MLRRFVLILALAIGALAFGQVPSQATPLGATAQTTVPAQAEQAQFYYYRRPRYYGYRYYRPRYYGYRYYRPRYYRPRYFYRRYW